MNSHQSKWQKQRYKYLHAKAEVLRRLRNKFRRAGEIEAKEKAEKLLEELKKEAGSYGA